MQCKISRKFEIMQNRVDLVFQDWGLVEYGEAWQRQETLFDEKIEKKIEGIRPENDFILCEHLPVYTLGRHGRSENMLVSEEQLSAIGAKLFFINRGGDITFHGPGQIVGYPIIDLEQFGLGLKAYIYNIEEVIIRTIAHWGISGYRLAGATGVWIDQKAPLIGTELSPNPHWAKICAIGVRASRYVTMHGFALNVNTDLRYFNYINPCGFTDKGVTSLKQLTGKTVDMEEVKTVIKQNVMSIF